MDLGGAVAVVTGASAGIGRATSIALAGRGATVVVSARREPLLAELTHEIRATGGTALAVACDVGELDRVRELHRRTIDAFGRVDVLVNNAGVPGGGPFAELTVEQVERIV